MVSFNRKNQQGEGKKSLSPTIITKVVKDQTNNLLIQLFRYTFVGGVAFVVDFSTLFLLADKLHLHYLLSAEISFILGLLVNYALSTSWVFANRTVGGRWMEFAIFAAIGAIGLALNALIMWSLTDLAHIHYLGSKIVSTFVVFFFNFFARKIILFR